MTRGELVISDCVPEHLDALVSKMRQAGAEVSSLRSDAVRVRAKRRLNAADITTEEYPGFATDLQAQYMAMMTLAGGASFITETIFENRFMHALELARMGADIRLEGRQAIVTGVEELTGAEVIASDLRASASLVLAGLVGRGETVVDRVYHIDRGYEKIEEKLARAGARIERVN
jgi:UDP-N-acetylglucosamine 1-carboxyvinyltransferase